jgi:putative transposase
MCRLCANGSRGPVRTAPGPYGGAVPRKLRPEIPGAFFHVFARGSMQVTLFRDDRDYEAWLRILARTVESFDWRCHAYCAMPNHFHLLIETPEPTRSAGMRHLSGSYAQRFNLRYDGSGHVFQGRYGSNTVEGDPQFLETCRYIVLNPVRAGLREAPHRWRWSSYRRAAGLTREPAFPALDLLLGMFGGTVQEAQQRYQRFVADGHVPGPGPEETALVTHASRP